MVGIADTEMDLGLIGEFAFDDRGPRLATTSYENDIMLGTRLSFNDPAGSTLLAGLVQDLDSRGRVLRFEASRRLGSSLKLIIESGIFSRLAEDDYSYRLRDDDFVQFEIVYYF